MKFATSAGVALALSFLFYDQRDLSEAQASGGGEAFQEARMSYAGAGISGGKIY